MMAKGLRTRRRLLLLAALGALVLWATVESPPLHYSCGDGEYYYSGICCKNCPAGTHVDEPCNVPHTSGHCAACREGEDYTAYENGLDACLRCDECKSGTTLVKPCTVKSNTECLCNAGYYCPPGCEECLKCKTKCTEGQIIVQICNATADMECGPPPTGASHIDYIPVLYIVLCAVVVCSIVIGIGIFNKKHCVPCRMEEKSSSDHLSTNSTDDLLSWKISNTDALPTENQEVHPSLANPASASGSSDLPENINLPLSHTKEVSSSVATTLLQVTDNAQSNSKVLPSNTERSAVVKPSHGELSEICEELPEKVKVSDWRALMRNAGLSDNDIDIIIHDYPFDTREQKYRMLKSLCDRFGPEDALCKLLNGLHCMKLTHIYENVQNELLSKNIIIVKDKGKHLYFVKNAEQNL